MPLRFRKRIGGKHIGVNLTEKGVSSASGKIGGGLSWTTGGRRRRGAPAVPGESSDPPPRPAWFLPVVLGLIGVLVLICLLAVVL